ncbi:hypothetical protein DF022_37470 [Burkholderia cepacia]|nr:type IVB secretion system protein IcmH/DotU [Burkholderia cepacia]RQT71882.1 hypothetical protein DF023_37415 [Burkholderia cepacia]RQT92296.1 hypothetical protein DF022_37470 [Burkholderia cepacia]RQZ68912.1 hypothetical protein DF056_37805 [Burkholderia cepacia]RQZ91540.1 hypothetical protein DF055_37705 [Burkholderia cepacia]RQZ96111.1 hypothetical protein DF054_37725 [Burkholderia cepacia]
MLDQMMANPDLATRVPTLSSLTNDAATGEPALVGETQQAKVPEPGHAPLRFPNPASDAADASPVVYSQQGGHVAIIKAGQQSASWSNSFVSHALPAVLQLRRHLSEGLMRQAAMRMQLSLEVRLYRERLAISGCEWEQIRDASYLLCTYLDECVNDAARAASRSPYDGERSLLVEFHDDAWGGEDAFSDLVRWMKSDNPPVALLAFYELILSLGWQGRYQVLERGDVLLKDLRSQLHALIWHHVSPESLGTGLITPERPRRRWWSPARASLVAFFVVLLSYGIVSLMLDAQGRSLRNELAAWTPPTRTINLAETLPPPLPQLLSEGWLTAYKHPRGWLLVFRSDGAFDVGKAQVRADFERNIERLGLAFAPWPGDLEVIGHTDNQPIRTSEYANNQILSEARARTVADELRKTALPGGARAPENAVRRNIEFSGRGDTQPIDSTKTQAAYERNRRVDVLWKVIPADSKRADDVAIAPGGQRPYVTEGN